MSEHTIAERFARLRDLQAAHAEATCMAGLVQAEIDAIRAQIRAAMEADGAMALRDKETGMSARIERRSTWKVTDWEALHSAIEDDANLSFELYEQQINTGRVIEMAKEGTVLPGVEQLVSDVFVVRGAA